MKFSFKLGKSANDDLKPTLRPPATPGDLVLEGMSMTTVGNRQTSNTTDLGFSQARDVKDTKLKNVTAFSGLSGSGTFIGEKVDTAFAATSKKRQRAETQVIECKKKLKGPESQSPRAKTIEEEVEHKENEDLFIQELTQTKGGLIVNRNSAKPSPSDRPSAPLLMRMSGLSEGVKSEGTIAFKASVKHEPGVISPSRLMDTSSVIVDVSPDYGRFKVEGHGEAILRGMGWDPEHNEAHKKRNRLVELKIRAYAQGGLGSDRFFEENKEIDVSKDPSKAKKLNDDDEYSYYSDDSSDSSSSVE